MVAVPGGSRLSSQVGFVLSDADECLNLTGEIFFVEVSELKRLLFDSDDNGK